MSKITAHIKEATGQNCLSRYATRGEAKKARRLVRAMLAAGLAISVNDGEEWTVRRSRSEAEILEALCSTGEDGIRGYDAEGASVGTFWLIWGNAPDGSELISDYTDNAALEAIINQVEAV
ncbi:hypothetical protein UFOVP4_26 [uncultured Caudovirales phage]|uniref:Uncharacterized protein n=1 Tax=uncultured Caudovirales phage TaxID=2100421 RepID=A0A6J7VSN7_9CAUD|nr:hypothetical protein UFOVP4_26 [uncultured Caudovirales phage]CAB4241294.1 hypothetical protein UFOVP64_34 [uncultured Caudovirales phage]CAB5079007.1 hypothetical protein UFOVP145_48 [uncultured Caudovirales phage]